jgi:ribA/ribD-fused uncharacterized protein
METQTNPLESTAFFEEKVPITPRDLAEDTVNIDKLLNSKLTQKLEGKCSLHGWVVPRSVKILSRSMGYVESGRFTGDIVYHVQVKGTVINPPSGAIVVGQVIRKNKMGMYVDYKGAIRIILPRDLHIGDESYEAVNVGQYVECEIKKSRFQVNDEFILSVGDFLGVSEKTDVVRTVEQLPLVEEEEEKKEEKKEEEKAQEQEEEQEQQQGEQQQEEEEGITNEQLNALTGGGAQTIEFSSKSPSYKELSNFHKAKMLLDGKEWPTVEHYFQAQKFSSSPDYQETIRAAATPVKAKSLGASKEYPIRNDWDTYREEVMKKALKAKFEQNADLKQLLKSTEGKALVEDTMDPYWGQGRNKKGKNRLGLLLMELRSQ